LQGEIMMNAQELTDYFYRDIKGYSVNLDSEKQTKLTLAYLLDNGIEKEEILDLLFQLKDNDCISHETLPDNLWVINERHKVDKRTGMFYTIQDNLVKRDTFYYHPSLMLRSKLPSIVNGKEVIKPYYCEPRCRFTVTDLIEYFCFKIQTNTLYMETEYARNSIFTGLKNYQEAFKIIEPLDIMMFSIDYAAQEGKYAFSTFMQLQQYLGAVIEELKVRVAHVRAFGYDKIVWRTE